MKQKPKKGRTYQNAITSGAPMRVPNRVGRGPSANKGGVNPANRRRKAS